MIGQSINKFIVKDSDTGKEYNYKTIAGARRKYDELGNHRVTIYQETTCVNEYITLDAK